MSLTNMGTKWELKNSWFLIFSFIPLLGFIPFFYMNARVESKKHKMLGWVTVALNILIIVFCFVCSDISFPRQAEMNAATKAAPSFDDYYSQNELIEKYGKDEYMKSPEYDAAWEEYYADEEAYWDLPENVELSNEETEFNQLMDTLSSLWIFLIPLWSLIICLMQWVDRSPYLTKLAEKENKQKIASAFGANYGARPLDYVPQPQMDASANQKQAQVSSQGQQPQASMNAVPQASAQTYAASAEPLNINIATEAELAALKGLTVIDAKKAISVREAEGGFKTKDAFYEAIKAKPHIIAGLDAAIVVGEVAENVPAPAATAPKRTIDF